MYSGQGVPQRNKIPAFLAIGCLGLTLFLIAATVVLALIPVYISNNSVPTSSTASKSKEVTLELNTEANPSTGRRKRYAGDLADYVGGVFGSSGNTQIGKQILANAPSSVVGDISVTSVTIAYQGTSKRRRFALRKNRATSQTIILIVKMYVIYKGGCFYGCQFGKAKTIQQAFYGMSLSAFVFTNVDIYKNGAFYKTAPRIQSISVTYVSDIIPGTSPSTAGASPATASTTTAITTPSLG